MISIVKSLIIIALAFSIFFSAFSVQAAEAKTLYVDKNNVGGTCNDNAAGTAVSSPLCTFTKAQSLAASGDTVYFRAGTYPPMLMSKSGTSSAYIKYASYPGETAIIDAAGGSYGIKAQNTRYLEIDGFEVKNAGGDYSGGIFITGSATTGTNYSITQSSHHNVVNNIVHDNRVGSRWTFGIRVVNSSYNTIQSNRSYRNFKCGITIEGGNDVPLQDNHIIQNTVYENNDNGGDADGICVYGNRNKGMLIQRNIAYANGDDGIDTWSSSGSIIEHNVVYGQNGPGDGNGIKLGGHANGGANTVRYNIVYGNKGNGLDSNGSGGNIYYHNVSYNNGAYGFEDGWRVSGALGCSPASDRCFTTLKNNIGFNNALGNLSAGNMTRTSDYNLWFSTTGGAKISYNYNNYSTLSQFQSASNGLDQHSVSMDPKFVSASSKDFKLQSGSPAIDKGTSVGITTDFDGNPVPQGSSPDIGAYEFSSSSTLPTQTPTHTPTRTPTHTPAPTSSPKPSSTVAPTITDTPLSTCAADINQDNFVDIVDYSFLVKDFFKIINSSDPPSNARSDINRDGFVDITDYSVLRQYFFNTCH